MGPDAKGYIVGKESAHLATSVTTATHDVTMNTARLLQAIAAPQTSITVVPRLPYSRSSLLSSPSEGITKISRTRSARKTDKFASDCQVCVTTSRTFLGI